MSSGNICFLPFFFLDNKKGIPSLRNVLFIGILKTLLKQKLIAEISIAQNKLISGSVSNQYERRTIESQQVLRVLCVLRYFSLTQRFYRWLITLLSRQTKLIYFLGLPGQKLQLQLTLLFLSSPLISFSSPLPESSLFYWKKCQSQCIIKEICSKYGLTLSFYAYVALT